MKEEPFFGQNLRKAIKVIKNILSKKLIVEDCPFCGKDFKITDTMNRGALGYYVRCPHCKCRGPVSYNYTEALNLWNDRKEDE